MAYKDLHDQARPRSQSNLDTVCAKHMPRVCYLRGFKRICSQPRKRLGSTSKNSAYFQSNQSIFQAQAPSSQHHLLDLLAQFFLFQLLFLSHPTHTLDRALYLLPIIQLRTIVTSASEIQPLPFEQLPTTESLKETSCSSPAGWIYIFPVTLFCAGGCVFTLLAFWGAHHPAHK